MIAFVQLVPAVLLTPFAAYAGDRFRPQRALAAGYAAQAACMVVVAAAMVSEQWLLVYGASTVLATAISFTRPVMGSLLPTLTHTPTDLVAANVVAGMIRQTGVFIGPLLAGVVMALGSPAGVFATCAVITGAACLALLATPAFDDDHRDVPDVGDLADRMFAGFATLRRVPRVRTLVGVIAVAGLVNGVADVLFVTFTDERLDGGGGQAGLLAAAYGLGGLIGAVVVTRLVHTTRIGGTLMGSAVLAAAALTLMASADGLILASLLFAMLGAGESVMLLTAAVTIQRRAPTDVLARVFGIVEGAQMGAVAVGGLLVTILVTRLTVSESFVVLGAVVLVLIGVGVIKLARQRDDLPAVDADVIDRLVLDPVLASLPAPTMERLGRTVERRRAQADSAVVVQGDVGDHYFLIVDGEFTVTRDGRTVAHLVSGQSFGEIALLRDVPRTSTVTAVTDAELLVIDRDDFLEAVTGHPRSLTTARAIAADHVGPVDD